MLTLEQLQAGLVIPIDKPRCWTSFQAVNKVKSTLRRLYGIKNIKIGLQQAKGSTTTSTKAKPAKKTTKARGKKRMTR